MVALCLFLLVMLLLVRISAEQKIKRDREELESLRELLNDQIPMSIKLLDEWRVEIIAAISLAENKRPIRRGEQRDEYDRQLFRRLLHYEQPEEFFSIFDKRLNGFATQAKRAYHLKDRELMFVCLSVIELSDERIALLMDYSVGSIATTRKRIGNKMGVENSSQWYKKLLLLIGKD